MKQKKRKTRVGGLTLEFCDSHLQKIPLGGCPLEPAGWISIVHNIGHRKAKLSKKMEKTGIQLFKIIHVLHYPNLLFILLVMDLNELVYNLT